MTRNRGLNLPEDSDLEELYPLGPTNVRQVDHAIDQTYLSTNAFPNSPGETQHPQRRPRTFGEPPFIPGIASIRSSKPESPEKTDFRKNLDSSDGQKPPTQPTTSVLEDSGRGTVHRDSLR